MCTRDVYAVLHALMRPNQAKTVADSLVPQDYSVMYMYIVDVHDKLMIIHVYTHTYITQLPCSFGRASA